MESAPSVGSIAVSPGAQPWSDQGPTACAVARGSCKGWQSIAYAGHRTDNEAGPSYIAGDGGPSRCQPRQTIIGTYQLCWMSNGMGAPQ